MGPRGIDCTSRHLTSIVKFKATLPSKWEDKCTRFLMVLASSKCPPTRVPADVLAMLPSYYLLKKDIGRLDIACSSKQLRPLWLEALRMMPSTGDLDVDVFSTYHKTQGTLWKLSRQIPIKMLWFPRSLHSLDFTGPLLPSIVKLRIGEVGVAFFGSADGQLQGLWDVCSRCCNLKELEIADFCVAPSVMGIVVGNCSKLHKLCFNGYGFRHGGLLDTTPIYCMTALSQMSHGIVDLEIRGADQSLFTTRLYDSVIRALPQLKQLTLSTTARSIAIDDDAICKLAAAYPALQSLEVSLDLSTWGVRFTASSFPQLRVLKVNLFCDENCRLLSKTCPLLEELELRGSAISDVGMTAIARGCSRLHSFSLIDLQCVTDASLHAIADYCQRLTYFRLNYCRQLTLDGILHLARTARALDTLNISNYTPRPTPEGAAAFSQPLRLKHIYLVYMNNLNDDMVEMLARCCPELVAMEIFSCPGISRSCVEYFRSLSMLRSLSILHCGIAFTPAVMRHIRASMPRVRFDFKTAVAKGT